MQFLCDRRFLAVNAKTCRRHTQEAWVLDLLRFGRYSIADSYVDLNSEFGVAQLAAQPDPPPAVGIVFANVFYGERIREINHPIRIDCCVADVSKRVQ